MLNFYSIFYSTRLSTLFVHGITSFFVFRLVGKKEWVNNRFFKVCTCIAGSMISVAKLFANDANLKQTQDVGGHDDDDTTFQLR